MNMKLYKNYWMTEIYYLTYYVGSMSSRIGIFKQYNRIQIKEGSSEKFCIQLLMALVEISNKGITPKATRFDWSYIAEHVPCNFIATS